MHLFPKLELLTFMVFCPQRGRIRFCQGPVPWTSRNGTAFHWLNAFWNSACLGRSPVTSSRINEIITFSFKLQKTDW